MGQLATWLKHQISGGTAKDGLRRRSQSITCIIKTRNSPQSAYVRDFQCLAKPCTINIHQDIYNHLDLTTAFKGLTIVTFTDDKSELQPVTSKQEDERPFFYALPSPSPTTTEEEVDIPELIDVLLPEKVEQDQLHIEDSVLSPPPVAYQQVNHKRRYSTQFPDIEEEACTHCG